MTATYSIKSIPTKHCGTVDGCTKPYWEEKEHGGYGTCFLDILQYQIPTYFEHSLYTHIWSVLLLQLEIVIRIDILPSMIWFFTRLSLPTICLKSPISSTLRVSSLSLSPLHMHGETKSRRSFIAMLPHKGPIISLTFYNFCRRWWELQILKSTEKGTGTTPTFSRSIFYSES